MTQPIPALRSDLKFTPHRQHERVWYAVEDPTTGRYVRLGRQEYLAAIHFDGQRDAAAILEAGRQIESTFSLTEKDLERLLGWLARSNLVATSQGVHESPANSSPISSRCVWDLFAARFPLVKGIYVEKIARSLLFLASVPSLVIVALLMLVATVTLVANWQEFFDYTEKLFVADGRMWWLVAWLLLKVVHEFGHAVTAVKAGSQIRSAGLSFIFFAPVPFIDVSDLWSISNRWRRILCSMGGMLFEIAVAAAAVLLAFATNNTSLSYFACAVAITGTFTTIAFNANPLVRFDGYFIMADVLQKSNLWGDGQLAFKELIRRIMQPFSKSNVPLQWNMAFYGLACTVYRYGILLGLGITALLVWQEYGVILIAWGCSVWFILPWWRARKAAKLAEIHATERAKGPSWIVWAKPALLGSMLVAVTFVPLPMQPNVPGIVGPREPSILRIETDGFLSEVLACEQDSVKAGDLVARFENPLLYDLVASKRVEVAVSTESIAAMRARGEIAQLQAEQAKLESLNSQLAQLEQRVEDLLVRAPVAGTIISSDLTRQVGKYFTAGDGLAWIANPREFEIKLSASQQEHSKLCNGIPKLHLINSKRERVIGFIDKIDWRGSDVLEDPALAATFGGPITVETGLSKRSDEGIKLPQPRFDVRMRIESPHTSGLVSGQLVWARLPNSSARLVDLLCHWINKKWEAAKQMHKNG